MTRSLWNNMVALLAVVGLGGTSGMLFAQSPAAPTERFVTVGIGNEKARCKVIQAWTLPSGGLAYQVRAVDSGELITIVRENAATPGGKETPVRVYRWRDPKMSPFGAPVPPTVAPNDESVGPRKVEPENGPRAEVKQEIIVVPPTITQQMLVKEIAAAPTIVNGPNGGLQTVSHLEPSESAAIRERINAARKKQTGETVYIPPTIANETIVIAASQLPAQPAEAVSSEVSPAPQPRMPVEIRPTPNSRVSQVPAAPRLETGPQLDTSVDSQGQAPWKQAAPMLVQPGKNPAEPAPLKTSPELVLAPPTMPATPAPMAMHEPLPTPVQPKTFSSIEIAASPLPPVLPVAGAEPRVRSIETLSADPPPARPPIPAAPSPAPQVIPVMPESYATAPPVPSAPKFIPRNTPVQQEIIEVKAEPAAPVSPTSSAPMAGTETWSVRSQPVSTHGRVANSPAAPAAVVPSTIPSQAKAIKQSGPRVPAVGYDRTRTVVSPTHLAQAANETIVEVPDPNLQPMESMPSVRKRTVVNRPPSVAGLIGREQRPSSQDIYFPPEMPVAAKAPRQAIVSQAAYVNTAPVVQKKAPPAMKNSSGIVGLSGVNRPAAAGFDRTKTTFHQASAPSFVPGMNSTKESVVVVDEGFAANDMPTVAKKKPLPAFSRTATLQTLMNSNATGHEAESSATVSSQPLPGSFDRSRVMVTPDQLAAPHSPMAANAPAMPESIVEVSEGTHEVIGTTPVVQKRAVPGTGRLPALVGFKSDRGPFVAGPNTEVMPFEVSARDPVDAKPQQPNAFTPAPQMQRPSMIENGDPAMTILPPYGVAMPQPAFSPNPPPVNLVNYAPKGPVGPANPAMDRPGSAVPAAVTPELNQLMQTAQEALQPSRREMAILSLSNYDGRTHPQLVEFLKQVAVSDPAATVRAAAVSALGRMNAAPQSVAGLLESLRTDSDESVRRAADETTAALGLNRR